MYSRQLIKWRSRRCPNSHIPSHHEVGRTGWPLFQGQDYSFLFYWNHFSKNYIQQTPSTGLGSCLCLKDHNSSGRQNCSWLLVRIVLHEFLVFLLHTLEVLSRSRSGSGSAEFLSLIYCCGAVTLFVSLYSVANWQGQSRNSIREGFPISTWGFNCTTGPATTLGTRGSVARFKSAYPLFSGGSNLALVRTVCCGFLDHLSLPLPLTEAMGVTPTYPGHLFYFLSVAVTSVMTKSECWRKEREDRDRSSSLKNIRAGMEQKSDLRAENMEEHCCALSDAGKGHLLRECHGPQWSGSSHIN